MENSFRTNIEFSKFRERIESKSPITFYNWECPIRSSLNPCKKSVLEFECTFLDNDESVEKTRMVKLYEKEKEFVKMVLSPLRDELGIQARYFKFLADTNPTILYPSTTEDKRNYLKIKRDLFSFANRLQIKANSIAGNGNISILQFSQILSIYPDEYFSAYNKIYYSFSEKSGNLQSQFIPSKFVRNELEELVKHTGASEFEIERIKELCKRVISSYAAEEFIIRNYLSATSWFTNPVAITNESMFSFPVLANAYLGKDKRGTWLFILYEKEEK